MTTPGMLDQSRQLLENLDELGEILEKRTGARRDLRKYALLHAAPAATNVGRIVAFAREELKATTVTHQQEQILRLYVEHRLSAVRSAPGIGKTFAIAIIALYHAYVMRGMVLALAASQRQITELLFAEIRRLWHQSSLPNGELLKDALRIDEQTGQKILGFVSNDSSRMRGFHHPRLLIITDESQGLPDFAWDGVQLMATGSENKVLAAGNAAPKPIGRWYAVQSDPKWGHLRLSARDHPNILEGCEIVPGGPSREWMATVPPPLRPLLIDAETPDSDPGESLVSRAMIDGAVARWHAGAQPDAEPLINPAMDPWLAPSRSAPTVIAGLDPARFGSDETALAIRVDDRITEIIRWEKLDTMETVERALEELAKRGYRAIHDWNDAVKVPALAALGYGPFRKLTMAKIHVDEIGLGAGVIDRLKQLNAYAEGINVATRPAPDAAERFDRLKDQTFWWLRDELEAGRLALPPDDNLAEELMAISWWLKPDGRIAIAAKDELRVVLGRSPDTADAVALTWSETTTPWARQLYARWG